MVGFFSIFSFFSALFLCRFDVFLFEYVLGKSFMRLGGCSVIYVGSLMRYCEAVVRDWAAGCA